MNIKKAILQKQNSLFCIWKIFKFQFLFESEHTDYS